MIRFEGYRSKETMRYVIYNGLKFCIPYGFIILIPCVFIIIFCNDILFKVTFSVPLALCGIMVMCIPPVSVKFEKKWSYLQFEIDQEYYGGSYRTGETENIYKVIDYGDCYNILLNRIAIGCIIQKNLIVEGTIEEFEELFQDKIVRKLKR